MSFLNRRFSRRQFVAGASAATVLPSAFSENSNTGATKSPIQELTGTEFHLSISEIEVNFTGRPRKAVAVNNTVPGPTLRMREGETVTIHVTNNLQEDTSIHWHGIILPSNMDGVPGLSFDGIKPGETFRYQFTLNQSGTYWYHSHSAYQEPLGLYGALVIEPKEAYANSYDQERVILLSDWSDENPENIYKKLKKQSHYYNTRERTLFDLKSDVSDKGILQTLKDRRMWNNMRMSDSDLSDVTGMTYTYLLNGCNNLIEWRNIFVPGEKIRLRVINASSMTIFDFRIPNLTMNVVASDGQEVQAVEVDEFRIGTAETYDVIVHPKKGAYTLFAQSIDRSAYVRGTLTSNENQQALIPAMDYRPNLSHQDMGMIHSMLMNDAHKDHQMMDHNNSDKPNQHEDINHDQYIHHETANTSSKLGLAGLGPNTFIISHPSSENGPQVDIQAEAPTSGLNDPGVGLREHWQRYQRRVLNYGDLRSMVPTRDKRQPSREIQLHLTGNMNRYMWSMDGIKFADAKPLQLTFGERVRIILVNDTMMTHPIHLHGLWSELETGDPNYIPRKHTILVQPGSTISYLVTADAEGRWAYHCHLLYHMAGMFREVRVTKNNGMPKVENSEHGGDHHGHH